MIPPMNDEERALLRAICAKPNEDAPRLVYADWLDERGVGLLALHAELIRASISAPPPDLEARLTQLIDLDGETFAFGRTIMQRLADPDARSRVQTFTMLRPRNWSRGFPCFLHAPSVPRFWSAVDGGLFLRVPIVSVQVNGRRIRYEPDRPEPYRFDRSLDEREVHDRNELPGAVCRWLKNSLAWPTWEAAWAAVYAAFALAGRAESGLQESSRN